MGNFRNMHAATVMASVSKCSDVHQNCRNRDSVLSVSLVHSWDDHNIVS